MGVNLGNIVERQNISFDDLKNKVIAIDAFNALYQFLSSIRQRDGTPLMDSEGRVTSHLQGLFTRTLNLMEKKIKLVYVFDGKSPELKLREKQEREKRKLIAKEKYIAALEKEDVEGMYKYSKGTGRLDEEMVKESKELLTALGLPVVQAPSEAEGQAAFMCRDKDVYAVGSQDFDSLLFGAPRLIMNLTLSAKRRLPGGKIIIIQPQMLELKNVLKDLEINQEQLIALGILAGTDFNVGGVKGIGPKKALKLVKENKKVEDIFKNLNVDFNWKKVFDIFESIDVTRDYKLKWDNINIEKIKKILVDKHDFSGERVDNLIRKRGNKKESDLSRFF